MRHPDLLHYYQLGYLLQHPGMSRKGFLSRFGLSEYQGRQTERALQNLQSEFGLAFDFKTFINCRITASALYNRRCPDLFAFCQRLTPLINSETDLWLKASLARLLLMAAGPLTVDSLAQQVGYSKSNIRDPLKWARGYIESYGLTVAVRPTDGLQDKGSQLKIRLCLSDLYGILDPAVVSPEDNYCRRRLQISRLVDEVVEQQQLDGLNTSAVVSYLSIAATRISAGFPPVQPDASPWPDRPSSTAARQISGHLGLASAGLAAETAALDYVLLINDFNPDDLSQLVKTAPAQSGRPSLYDVFYHWLNDELQLPLSRSDENYLHQLTDRWMLADACRRLESRFYGLDQISTAGDNVLLALFDRQAREMLSNYFGYEPSAYAAAPLLSFISYLILLQPVHYPPLKIGLISQNGLEGANRLKQLIKANVSRRYYQTAAVLDYRSAIKDTGFYYDLLITDSPISGPLQDSALLVSPAQASNLDQLVRKRRNLCAGNLHLLTTTDQAQITQRLKKTAAAVMASSAIRFIYIPASDSSRNWLAVGPFQKGCGLLFQGRLTSRNIRFYYELLNLLCADYSFAASLLANPTMQLINEKLNEAAD